MAENNQSKEGGIKMELMVIRSQHQELRKIIQELHDILKEEGLEENQLLISLKIGTLNGILSLHLNLEDDHMYPYLSDHPNHDLSKTANDFKSNMGSLSGQFSQYMDRFLRHPDGIRNKTEDFIRDTRQILSAILTRIELEEHRLFPLL